MAVEQWKLYCLHEVIDHNLARRNLISGKCDSHSRERTRETNVSEI